MVTLLVGVAVIALGFGVWKRHGSSVESQVQKYAADPAAVCAKAGVMAFAGAQSTVYQCEMRSTYPGWRCFVRVGGDLYEVTDRIAALRKAGVVKGFRCGSQT